VHEPSGLMAAAIAAATALVAGAIVTVHPVTRLGHVLGVTSGRSRGFKAEGPDYAIFFPRDRTSRKVAYPGDAALPLAPTSGERKVPPMSDFDRNYGALRGVGRSCGRL
jgi:hypothetical protein